MVEPVISVITPIYNRSWCIGDCIASAALKGMPVEMIIVDDGSTDGSVEVARTAIVELGLQDQIHILEQPNAGPSAARNRAAAMARGEWLAFLDSDDLWFPWTLSRLLEAVSEAHDGVDLMFAHGLNFSDRGELDQVEACELATEVASNFVEAVAINPRSRYGACNAIVRRRAFVGLGGFAPELRCAEDTDFFLRVMGDVTLIRQPVLVGMRRSGHESLTGNIPEVVKGFEWMRAGMPLNRYKGGSDDLNSFLAGSCAYSIRAAFAAGFVGTAYRLYFAHLRLLSRERTRKYLLRLPLTPLLHFYKPQAYPFRLSPRRR